MIDTGLVIYKAATNLPVPYVQGPKCGGSGRDVRVTTDYHGRICRLPRLLGIYENAKVYDP